MKNSVIEKIMTAYDFKTKIVDEDYSDFKRNETSLRSAYHLALGLFHLRDWTFYQYSKSGTWNFSNTQKAYQTELESLCPSFGYIRDLANAVKHAELDPKMKHSTTMVGLANTAVTSIVFDPAAFENTSFQTQIIIVTDIGTGIGLKFTDAAQKVKIMWDDLFAKNNWH